MAEGDPVTETSDGNTSTWQFRQMKFSPIIKSSTPIADLIYQSWDIKFILIAFNRPSDACVIFYEEFITIGIVARLGVSGKNLWNIELLRVLYLKLNLQTIPFKKFQIHY